MDPTTDLDCCALRPRPRARARARRGNHHRRYGHPCVGDRSRFLKKWRQSKQRLAAKVRSQKVPPPPLASASPQRVRRGTNQLTTYLPAPMIRGRRARRACRACPRDRVTERLPHKRPRAPPPAPTDRSRDLLARACAPHGAWSREELLAATGTLIGGLWAHTAGHTPRLANAHAQSPRDHAQLGRYGLAGPSARAEHGAAGCCTTALGPSPP